MPHDLPLPRVNTLGSDEGSMKLEELLVFCTNLSKKVKSLETDLKLTKQVYGGKLIMKVKKLEKTVKSSHATRRARIVGRHGQDMEFESNFDVAKEVSTAEEEVSTAKPVSTVGAAVTTDSVVVSTVSPARVSTTNDITMAEILVYIRRSASKDKAMRLQAELEEEERHRIAKVHEEANSFNVEE
ncbi:hypothetical protein Tco_1116624 [Tanacetum coccineum]